MGKGQQFGGGAGPADTILPEDREGFGEAALGRY
jgi:hypothetical protein